MTGLSLTLLGRFAATLNDRPLIKFRTKRTQALLVYLVAESTSGDVKHQREALMELLWPGLPPKSARSNLRQTLYYLRQAIGDSPTEGEEKAIPFLLSDRTSVGLNPDYPALSDVGAFTQLLDGPEAGWPEAIALYQGDFLADFYLPDANPFEEWTGARRAAYRRQVLGALDTLTADRLARGNFEEAERLALRQIEIDILRESGYRQLMQLYAWSGRHSEALNLYQQCVRVLDEELDSPPDETTTALYEAIRDNQLPPPPKKAALLVEAISPEPAGLPESPYRGLLSFREEDAAFYFGREAFTDRLLSAVESQPLVAVIGPSGSGKSSVLHAGLLARLRPNESWVIANFRPGSQPFHALAATLSPLLEPELTETDRLVEMRKLALALEGGDLPLNDVIDRIQQKAPLSSHMLIVIDHFEELYTLGPEPTGHRRFLDSLLDVAGNQQFRPELLFSTVLALRADFLEQVLAYRPFADAMQDASLILGPMNQEELGWAIENPAEKQGVLFEPGLVERMLNDVGDEPGNLPLLEFALAALWERQSERQLSHASYESIGRVDGALTRYADEVYENLGEDQRERARHVFVQLVRPGEQTADTRRLSRREELGEENWALAQRLADARLVVIDRDPAGQETAELAHETLIRSWGRLLDWLDEDRSFRIWQERLRAALHQWMASEQDSGALLRGIPLDEAEGWLTRRRDQLSASEIAFIKESYALRERRVAEEEGARLAQERTRRRITIGLAAGLIIAVILLALAGWQWNSARQAREIAEAERDQTQSTLSHLLASQAQVMVSDQPDLAQLLAIEAFNKEDSPETRGSLLAVISHLPQLHSYLQGHEDQVRSVAISPDGRTLATAGDDNTIQLWDLTEDSASFGQPLGSPLTGHADSVWSLAFSPDGRLLASGSFDDTIILWDVAEGSTSFGQPLGSPLSGHSDNVWSVVFSPNGEMLTSGSADGTIRFWNVEKGQQIGSALPGHDGTIATLAFDPEGQFLASGGRDGSVLLWDVTGVAEGTTVDVNSPPARQLGLPLTGHEGLVRTLAFSPDGQVLASGGYDNAIRFWDISDAGAETGNSTKAGEEGTGAEPIGGPIFGHTERLTALAFGTDGSSLASAGADGRVILWDISPLLEQGSTIDSPDSQPLAGQGEAVWGLAFSPNGRTLVTGSADGRITLWDVTGQHPLVKQFAGSTGRVGSVALSPDGQTVAVGDDRGSITLWDVSEHAGSITKILDQPLIGLSGENTSSVVGTVIYSIFSPDGRVLAAGNGNGSINLFDMTARRPITSSLTGHTGFIKSLSFSPDGQTLASIAMDGTIRFWDGESGQPLSPPLTGQFGREEGAVIFSPQGDSMASVAGGKVILWDIDSAGDDTGSDGDSGMLTPSQRLSVNFFPSQPPSVVFSPDGQTLAVGFIDDDVTLIDVATEEQLDLSPTEGGGAIWGMVYTPDGRTMVTASQNGQVILRNMDEGSATYGQPYGPPIDGPGLRHFPRFSFSENGLKIAATGQGSAVVLWDADIDSWQSIACRRASRNLTQEEWQQFFGDEPYRLTCPELPSGVSDG